MSTNETTLCEVGAEQLRGAREALDRVAEYLAMEKEPSEAVLRAEWRVQQARGLLACPCGDGPGHGPEWCEDYTAASFSPVQRPLDVPADGR
jgi:hypothetical protein